MQFDGRVELRRYTYLFCYNRVGGWLIWCRKKLRDACCHNIFISIVHVFRLICNDGVLECQWFRV